MRTNSKIFTTLTILAIIYWLLFDFLRWNQYDSPSFIGGARLLFGLDGGLDFQSRLTKPLVLILPGFIEFISSINPKYIFLIQNIIFFYLSGFFVYKINKLIFCDDKPAYLGMLIYVTCQPFAIFSLFILSDVAGWFFGIFTIYLTLKYFSKHSVKQTHFALIGFISGIGFLFKESAIIGLIFTFSYILFQKQKITIKLKNWVIVFAGFIIPVVISYLIIEHFYHDSVIKRILTSHISVANDEFKLSNLKQIYRVIDEYWFLFLIGIIGVFRSLKASNIIVKSSLITLLISSALMPVWPYLIDRILFMLAPILIIISVRGVLKFKHFSMLIVFIGGVLNIISAYIIYKYNPTGVLFISTISYLIILTVFWWMLYKQRSIKMLIE